MECRVQAPNLLATSRDSLFVVADAYPNVRLWCNTEPAFWLLAEPEIFASNSLS
mgnify:CR=1 FL=1